MHDAARDALQRGEKGTQANESALSSQANTKQEMYEESNLDVNYEVAAPNRGPKQQEHGG